MRLLAAILHHQRGEGLTNLQKPWLEASPAFAQSSLRAHADEPTRLARGIERAERPQKLAGSRGVAAQARFDLLQRRGVILRTVFARAGTRASARAGVLPEIASRDQTEAQQHDRNPTHGSGYVPVNELVNAWTC
jgi:hypothetical protein